MKSGWQNLAKARAEPGGYIYLKQTKHLGKSLFLNLPYHRKKFNFFWSASIPKRGMWRGITTMDYGADPLK